MIQRVRASHRYSMGKSGIWRRGLKPLSFLNHCKGLSKPFSLLQHRFQKWSCPRSFRCRHFLRRSLRDDFPAVLAGLRPDVEDPVGLGGDGHVVFDDDDGVAFIDEAVEDVDEAFHVLEVES